MGVSPLLARTHCQLSGPVRLTPGRPPLTNGSGILCSGTARSWGNLYSDQNTGQKPHIKSHNKVNCAGEGGTDRRERGHITVKT